MADDLGGRIPRLTQTVNKGGCAAKLAAGTLTELLRELPRQSHPDLLVGTDFLDDAAAWRLNPSQAIVQTLDFFTPIVDDPEDFGQIAAANAVSDVFAMGAEPITALTILAFPVDVLPGTVLTGLMRGATRTLAEAGARLVGGHSIDDDTLKFGFAVTGVVHPDGLWTNRGARPGDVLLLTKAIGTGTLTGGLKSGEVAPEQLQEALASMKAVNRLDLPTGLRSAVHAATDVTGFGLLGHAAHLADGSGVTLRIEPDLVPLLAGARASLERGVLTKAHRSNTLYIRERVAGHETLSEATWWCLVDPQTSGGLLLALDPQRADDVLALLRESFPRTARIGEVTARETQALRLA
jgi:selenide,water dikinase